VFNSSITIGGKTFYGIFLWNSKEQTVTTVAVKGMPAVDNLTFGEALGYGFPMINNRDEIAFDGEVKEVAGKPAPGVFVSGPDGKLMPIALPDQELPGGQKVLWALSPSIDDAGRVAFLATSQSGGRASAYLWEQGTISPVAIIGADAPGGGQFESVTAARLNNKNRNVLVVARLQRKPDYGLYLFAEGTLRSVAVRGQPMPGGGTFRTLLARDEDAKAFELSEANALGHHAFVAVLEDGSTAAYRMEPDGTLSLILKRGQSTELGQIQRIGRGPNPATSPKGIGLNSKGQVALTVKVAGRPDTLVLLTPTVP
jgi:hypothetical protein